MSGYLATGALERSVRPVPDTGPPRLAAKRAQQGHEQLREMETQIQVPISGVASSGAAWDKVVVPFDVMFLHAPEQRDNPLPVPHFTWGAHVSGTPSPDGAKPDPNNPDSHVGIFCHVVEYLQNHETNTTTGALVAVGVTTHGGNDVRFDGFLHLTFQGYGALYDTNAPMPNP